MSNDSALLLCLAIAVFVASLIGALIWKKAYWNNENLESEELEENPDGFSPSNAWLVLITGGFAGSIFLIGWVYTHPTMLIPI
jgi:hypothetical protein